MAIDNTEADSVLGQLAKGPVTVSIDDSGQIPYAYVLRHDQEVQIPGSRHNKATSRQLAEVDSIYHAAAPSTPLEILAWPTQAGHNICSGTLLDFTGPGGSICEYQGPLSPGTLRRLDIKLGGFAVNPVVSEGLTWTVFSQPASSNLDWG